MSQVRTEGTNLAVVIETALGVAATTGWRNLQPNSYGDIGPSIKKVARTHISKNRQRQRPVLVDLDSAVPWEADLTYDVIDVFAEGIFMADTKESGGTGTAVFVVTAAVNGAPSSFTVAAGGALATNRLVYARGWQNAINNGVHVVAAASTGTSIKVNTALVNETPAGAYNVGLEVAGVQGATGDIQIDGSGDIITTVLDCTTLGLQVGQWIWVGDLASGSAFAFANLAYTGYARVKGPITATKIPLEFRDWTVGASDSGAGKTIRLLFGRWLRNVAMDHADYKEPSYTFEMTYPRLGAGPVDEYEYMKGNFVDEWKWNLPLTDKATVSLTFIGTNSDNPTTSRLTGASTATNPLTNIAVSTSVDLPRLRVLNVDESGIATDFKSIAITFKNNVSPEKALGRLGAALSNIGVFEVMADVDVIFTNDTVIKAIRDNRTANLSVGVRNGDFGALIDVPSMTIDEGDRQFGKNESVRISTKSSAFQDAKLGCSASLSLFPYLPAASS